MVHMDSVRSFESDMKMLERRRQWLPLAKDADHDDDSDSYDLREYVMCIDSSQRDRDTYPNPNHFRAFFLSPLSGVVRCKLLDAEVPHYSLNVTAANQTFVWTKSVLGGGHATLSGLIPTGFYTGRDLADAITYIMNTKTTSPTPAHEDVIVYRANDPYEVAFRAPFNDFTFRTKKPIVDSFKLDMSASTCNALLGFESNDTGWVGAGASISSQRPIDLKAHNHIYLSIPELDTDLVLTNGDRAVVSSIENGSVRSYFARLPLQTLPGRIEHFSTLDDTLTAVASRNFVPPLAQLNSLTFRWLAEDGGPLDTDFLDLAFTLRFYCLCKPNEVQ